MSCAVSAIPTVYAQHASDEFNARLHRVLERLTTDVQQALGDNLIALVLGGGYGRGEGGVVRVNGIEQPYNDLDFALVVKRKRAVPWEVLAVISEKYAAELAIHVDFSRPLTLRDIEHWPHWLMWFDLLNGHIVLAGPSDVLTARAPAALRQPLPVIEATRLLLNRGAGLLWALRVVRGVEPPPDADFVRRNYYKCALALGDALLIAHQRYATPYRGRDERLAQLMRDSDEVAAFELASLYGTALAFKFCPDEAPEGELDETQLRRLAQQWGSVFLHVEQRRTGLAWPSLAGYTRWRGLREPEQHTLSKWLRNIVRNRQRGIWSWRYPREQLYGQLPVLLGVTETPIADWPLATARFLEIWRQFN